MPSTAAWMSGTSSSGGRGFFERSDSGHLDLPRAREGGFGGGFFACWAPPDPASGWTEESALTMTEDGYEVADAPPLDPAYARDVADDLAACLFGIEARSRGQMKVVRTARELESCLRNGVLAAVLHFEGAENLGPDPDALGDLYEVGLRSLGLVWSRPNAYGHGVPFRFPASPDTGPGLSNGALWPHGLAFRCPESSEAAATVIRTAHMTEGD